MDRKKHDVQTAWTDNTYLYVIVDGTIHRIRWTDCSRRLLEADDVQRARFEISPSGYGIHWPELDEDLAIASLLPEGEAVAQIRDREQLEYAISASSTEAQTVAEPRASYRADSLTSASGYMIDHQLLAIARSLPPSRAAQLVDFARFLEAQSWQTVWSARMRAWKQLRPTTLVGMSFPQPMSHKRCWNGLPTRLSLNIGLARLSRWHLPTMEDWIGPHDLYERLLRQF